VDELDTLLDIAPACIPDIIRVINTLSYADPNLFYSMINVVEEALGEASIDPRLLAQYAISIVCAQEVCIYLKRNYYARDFVGFSLVNPLRL
jgi:hypothetical protein